VHVPGQPHTLTLAYKSVFDESPKFGPKFGPKF
jgi:hypothetical protein